MSISCWRRWWIVWSSSTTLHVVIGSGSPRRGGSQPQTAVGRTPAQLAKLRYFFPTGSSTTLHVVIGGGSPRRGGSQPPPVVRRPPSQLAKLRYFFPTGSSITLHVVIWGGSPRRGGSQPQTAVGRTPAQLAKLRYFLPISRTTAFPSAPMNSTTTRSGVTCLRKNSSPSPPGGNESRVRSSTLNSLPSNSNTAVRS